ncbi:Uncharacterised protein g2466 [Pycnogonum litorale]
MTEINYMPKVIKDLGEVYARLFDHRAFLQGEHKFFLKEFEEKRQDQEIKNIFSIVEKVTETKETELERIQQNGDTYLSPIQGNLNLAIQMCDKIIERGEKSAQVATQDLQRQRVGRRSEWDCFIANIQDQKARVDKMFIDKERELNSYFEQLEKSLS